MEQPYKYGSQYLDELTPKLITRLLTTAVSKITNGQPAIIIGHSTSGFAALAVAEFAHSWMFKCISEGIDSMVGKQWNIHHVWVAIMKSSR